MSDVVRISESYFRRLLYETSPAQAVRDLSAAWALRERIGNPNYSLTIPERNTSLCVAYAWEVGTGGHAYLFRQNPKVRVLEMLGALGAVGLSELCPVLHAALALASPYPELSIRTACRRVRGVSDDALFVDVDRHAWAHPVSETLLNYLRHNDSAILLHERGLNDATSAR